MSDATRLLEAIAAGDPIDMSAFVAEQRTNVREWRNGKLLTPLESVYVPADPRLEEIRVVHHV